MYTTKKSGLWLEQKEQPLRKSSCTFCHGTGILKVIYKGLGSEEKNLRACPLCYGDIINAN